MKKLTLFTLFLLFTSILFSIENNSKGILFSYDGKAESVFLVGSMNDWNATASPMEKDENGLWVIVLKLNSGKHTYKFVVDGNWYYDQTNPNIEDDGYGGTNSFIEIEGNNVS